MLRLVIFSITFSLLRLPIVRLFLNPCVMLDFRIVVYYTISISIKIRYKGTRSYCAMLYLSICQASEDIIIMIEKKSDISRSS